MLCKDCQIKYSVDHFDLFVSKFVFHNVFYFIISSLPGCMLNRKEKKDKIANTEFSSDKGACASCHCDAGNKGKNTGRR